GIVQGGLDNPPAIAGPTDIFPDQTMCTMDAMICPDGSAVDRSGPNCEFDPCPTEITTDTWQSFTSPELGIAFSHPMHWTVSVQESMPPTITIGNQGPAVSYMAGEGPEPIVFIFESWRNPTGNQVTTIDQLKRYIDDEIVCSDLSNQSAESRAEQSIFLPQMQLLSIRRTCSSAGITSDQQLYYLLDGKGTVIKMTDEATSETTQRLIDALLPTVSFTKPAISQ
ncbi:MAG: hypothetical protein M3Q81_05400, partial [bacterium]|nr:hypothetical protein [bacterium]